MSSLAATDDLFYARAGLDRARVEQLVREAAHGADDGELYLEYGQSEAFSWDDGKLKSASFDTAQGFGLRAVADETFAYAHSGDLSEAAIRRAAETVRAVTAGHGGTLALPPRGTNTQLYTPDNPLPGVPFETKIDLLAQIDAYARSRDPRVAQVMCSLTGSWQAVQIVRPDGSRTADLRPLVRLSVNVVAKQGDRMESGNAGGGGRYTYDRLFDPAHWRKVVDQAVRGALTNLDSVPAPAGEMTVVLGPGWPAVMLHEAIGHGLEGDFNRKKTSAFTNLLGQRIAAPGITVVDDGTLEGRRGSLTVDDEGTPSQCNVLIEDGILKGFMQDRLNARLMGMPATGNGRRESFQHAPLPRMTNTYMRNGTHTPEEVIASVRRGVYATNFGGGQVDIVSGKYVFAATEAWLIEDGKITAPLKGATLIGNGPQDLKKISMIANDMALDDGIGVCGKAGQGVPVGTGQPTLRMDAITVGGTAAAS
ncbi:MAG: tldD [Rhodospirillales bacterium]|nr:tldD [Rhodospirillales bacterium]